jgi:hypothetical protein
MPLLNSGTVNFFGPNTPAVDAQIRATNFVGKAFEVSSQLDSVQAKGSRDVLQMASGPLAVALGVEARKEKYDFVASPEIQTGDVSGYGGNFTDTHRSRDVDSVFGEADRQGPGGKCRRALRPLPGGRQFDDAEVQPALAADARVSVAWLDRQGLPCAQSAGSLPAVPDQRDDTRSQ